MNEQALMGGYLHPEWINEERMRVLMGPMPGTEEQVARVARHTFWAAAVQTWARLTKRPCFSLSECQSAFRRGTQNPQCLPQVLQLMMSQGEIVALDQLCLGDPRETWLGWGRRVLLATPTQLVWGQLKKAVGLDAVSGGVLVCRTVLQEMCGRVLEKVWAGRGNNTTLLFTLPDLHTLVREEVGSADNLTLAVEVMVGQGRAATVTHQRTMYVKFVLPGDSQRPEITRDELAKSDLLRAKQRVDQRIESLEEERQTLRTQAKTALKRGAKTEALSLLRRRKRVDRSMETQLGVLENLTSWLHHLNDVDTNREVLGALKGGVEALRTALAGHTSPTAAAATLDDLQEVLEECAEVNSMLGHSVEGQDDVTCLEEELKELLLKEEEEEEGGKKPALPDVPTSMPFADRLDPTQRLSS